METSTAQYPLFFWPGKKYGETCTFILLGILWILLLFRFRACVVIVISFFSYHFVLFGFLDFFYVLSLSIQELYHNRMCELEWHGFWFYVCVCVEERVSICICGTCISDNIYMIIVFEAFCVLSFFIFILLSPFFVLFLFLLVHSIQIFEQFCYLQQQFVRFQCLFCYYIFMHLHGTHIIAKGTWKVRNSIETVEKQRF